MKKCRQVSNLTQGTQLINGLLTLLVCFLYMVDSNKNNSIFFIAGCNTTNPYASDLKSFKILIKNNEGRDAENN